MAVRVAFAPLRGKAFCFDVDTATAVAFRIILRPQKWFAQALTPCCGQEFTRSTGPTAPLICRACSRSVDEAFGARLSVTGLPYEAVATSVELEDWLQALCQALLPPLEAEAMAWALQERLGALSAFLEAYSISADEAEAERLSRVQPGEATYARMEAEERATWRDEREVLLAACLELSLAPLA